MYSLIALAHGNAAAVTGVLADLGGAVAPVMEGNFNGGDVSAHFVFPDEQTYRAARPAIDAALARADRADTAYFAHGENGVAAPGLATGVHRTLFLCADRNASPARLAQFEAEMVRMPHYIPAIRNWRLSRVIEAGGERRWTHVWEQEYDDIGGLMGPYMIHPYHWAFIDRWFDHECPDWLVDLRLCHSFAMYGRALVS